MDLGILKQGLGVFFQTKEALNKHKYKYKYVNIYNIYIEAKKKQAVHDERVNYLQVALL